MPQMAVSRSSKIVSWRRGTSNGGYEERAMHSGEKNNPKLWMKDPHGPRVEINYSKLKQLCARNIPRERQSSATGSSRDDHARFMTEYSTIFKRNRSHSVDSYNRPRLHTCHSSTSGHLGDISSYMIAIHGREKKEQEEIDLTARLRAMSLIVRKIPIQRTSTDVKQLTQHLAHFSHLFPTSECPLLSVLTGLASRVYAEELPKQGYSLPDHSGVYLILQGTVEKLSQDPDTKVLSSEMLVTGDSFGSLEESEGQDHVIKSSYPMYTTNEACIMLRITQVDYQRVSQKCLNAGRVLKEGLLRMCPLLRGVSPSTLNKLSQNITWETVTGNTLILNEGQTITKVGFIQEGRCVAYAQLPHTIKAEVTVGELGPGDCIGEVLLRGNDVQPYKIVSTSSKMRIGWITSLAVKVSEIEKHIIPGKEFSLPLLTKEALCNMYADKILNRQWGKVRRDIMNEVIRERGIMFGASKWQHARSQSAT